MKDIASAKLSQDLPTLGNDAEGIEKIMERNGCSFLLFPTFFCCNFINILSFTS